MEVRTLWWLVDVSLGWWRNSTQSQLRYQKGLSVKTSMIPRASMHEYCCPNGVYDSTCTILLALVLTETGVSDICCSIITLTTRMTWPNSSASTSNRPSSATLVILVVVQLASDISCTISIGTGCAFHGTIFFSVGKFPLEPFPLTMCQVELGSLSPWQPWIRHVRRLLRLIDGALLCRRLSSFRSLHFAVAFFCWRGSSSSRWVCRCPPVVGSIRCQCQTHNAQDPYSTSLAH